VGVLTIVWGFGNTVCVLVFTVFYVICTGFLYCFVYVFLFVLSVLVYGLLSPNENSFAVSK